MTSDSPGNLTGDTSIVAEFSVSVIGFWMKLWLYLSTVSEKAYHRGGLLMLTYYLILDRQSDSVTVLEFEDVVDAIAHIIEHRIPVSSSLSERANLHPESPLLG